MTSIYNGDYSLATLPELPLLDAINKIEPRDIGNLSQVNKRFYSLCQENSLWKIVAEKIGFSLAETTENNTARDQVRSYVVNIKQEIKNLKEPLPEDIAKIVESNSIPSYEEIKLLKDYRKARDTIVVWRELAGKIGPRPSFNFKTSKEIFQIIEKKDFDTCCTQHQNSLALQGLNLSNNHLYTLPSEIGYLTQLKYLDLSRNKFSILPSEIGYLTQLKYLDLSRNKFSTLPSEITQLTQLQSVLYLNNNQLSTLPSEIGQLTQLQGLNLRNNQLSTLPSEIGQLTQLWGLDLSNNKLSILPAGIGQLTKLKWLYLDNNQLCTLPLALYQLNIPTLLTNGNPLSYMNSLNYYLYQHGENLLEKTKYLATVISLSGLAYLAYYYPNEIISGLPYMAATGAAIAIQKLVHRYFQ